MRTLGANGGNHQVVHLTALARRDLLDQLTALVRGEFLKMPPQEELYQNIASAMHIIVRIATIFPSMRLW